MTIRVVVGLTAEQLKIREDVLEGLVTKNLRLALRALTANLGDIVTAAASNVTLAAEPPPPGSTVPTAELAVVTSTWAASVSSELYPYVAQTFLDAAEGVYGAVEAAATGAVPEVTLDLTAHYLGQAKNLLLSVGDDVWQQMRAQLAEGYAAGEDMHQLATRLRGVSKMSFKKATAAARTAVISAANAGSLAQVQAGGFTDEECRKEWLATEDERTREAHRRADGQRVGINEPFLVGGEYMQRPGDESASLENVASCRCALGFVFADDDEENDEDEPVTAAGDPDWDESKVKRDSEGKFAEKAGTKASTSKVAGASSQTLSSLTSFKKTPEPPKTAPLKWLEARSKAATQAKANRAEYRKLGLVENKIGQFVELWTGISTQTKLKKEITKGEWDEVVEAARSGITAPTLYRGFSLKKAKPTAKKSNLAHQTFLGDPDKFIAELQPGKELDLGGISAFTEDQEHAETFGDVTFVMTNGRGIPIETISNTPFEHEWLLTGKMRVESVEKKGKKYTVHVKLVDDDQSKTGLKDLATKILTPTLPAKTAPTIQHGPALKINTATVYKQVYQDGAVVAVNPGEGRRLRWSQGKQKFLYQKFENGHWQTTAEYNKKQTYTKFAKEDGWFAPAATATSIPSPTASPPAKPTPPIWKPVDDSSANVFDIKDGGEYQHGEIVAEQPKYGAAIAWDKGLGTFIEWDVYADKPVIYGPTGMPIAYTQEQAQKVVNAQSGWQKPSTPKTISTIAKTSPDPDPVSAPPASPLPKKNGPSPAPTASTGKPLHINTNVIYKQKYADDAVVAEKNHVGGIGKSRLIWSETAKKFVLQKLHPLSGNWETEDVFGKGEAYKKFSQETGWMQPGSPASTPAAAASSASPPSSSDIIFPGEKTPLTNTEFMDWWYATIGLDKSKWDALSPTVKDAVRKGAEKLAKNGWTSFKTRIDDWDALDSTSGTPSAPSTDDDDDDDTDDTFDFDQISDVAGLASTMSVDAFSKWFNSNETELQLQWENFSDPTKQSVFDGAMAVAIAYGDDSYTKKLQSWNANTSSVTLTPTPATVSTAPLNTPSHAVAAVLEAQKTQFIGDIGVPSTKPTMFHTLTPMKMAGIQEDMLGGQKWTAKQIQAVQRYTTSVGYQTTNAALRNDVKQLKKFSAADLNAGAASAIELQSAMKPLTESVVLHRGVGAQAFGFPDINVSSDDLKKLQGTVIKDPGFVSTSIVEPTNISFDYAKKPIKVIVRAPEGTPALYVSSATPGYNLENELILGAGTSFHLEEVRAATAADKTKYGSHTEHVVIAKVVPTAKSPNATAAAPSPAPSATAPRPSKLAAPKATGAPTPPPVSAGPPSAAPTLAGKPIKLNTTAIYKTTYADGQVVAQKNMSSDIQQQLVWNAATKKFDHQVRSTFSGGDPNWNTHKSYGKDEAYQKFSAETGWVTPTPGTTTNTTPTLKVSSTGTPAPSAPGGKSIKLNTTAIYKTSYAHGAVVAVRPGLFYSDNNARRLVWHDKLKKFILQQEVATGTWINSAPDGQVAFSKGDAYKTFGKDDGWQTPHPAAASALDQPQFGGTVTPKISTTAAPKTPKTPKPTPLAETDFVSQYGAISHLTADVKGAIFKDFKKLPNNNLKAEPQDVFTNAFKVGKSYKLNTLQILRTIDDHLATVYSGGVNQNKYVNKIIDWLKTPEGAQNAAFIKEGLPVPDPIVKPIAAPGTLVDHSVSGTLPTLPLNTLKSLKSPNQIGTPSTTATVFSDITSVKAGNLQKQMLPNPSSDQQSAIYSYSSSGYVDINGVLRGTFSTYNSASNLNSYAKQAVALQSAMRPIPQSIVVYRGTYSNQFPGLKEYDGYDEVKKFEGTVIRDRGFLSTSVQESTAFGGKTVKLIIEVPEGTPAMYIKQWSSHQNENEMLLAAGLKYHVVSVTKDGTTNRSIVRLRVVP